MGALVRRPGRRRSVLLAVGALAGAVVLWPAVRRVRAGVSAHPSSGSAVTRAEDGVELHVETAGRQDSDVTVLLVHGYGASLQEWQRQRGALAPHARLVLYDQRGHGRSGWRHHRRATFEQLGRDLLVVLREHCGRQPTVLVGHSMGGMAVLALAASRPELFGGTVIGVGLLSTSAGHLMEIGLPSALAEALRRSRVVDPALWLLWSAAPLVDRGSPFATRAGRRLLRRRLFGPDAPGEHDLDLMQRQFRSTRTSVLAAFAPALLHHDRAGALSALRGLPVLVLTGADDATIPAAHSHRLVRELAGQCELVVVPGAGHMVNLTHPGPVDAALRRLLDSSLAHLRRRGG